MTLIELDHVNFRYPQAENTALTDITLNIEEGERVAVVGANGSGKTTLGRLLNALYLPESGRVSIAGMDTRRIELHRPIRQVVGMVFQNPEDQLVAAEYVALAVEITSRSNARHDRKRKKWAYAPGPVPQYLLIDAYDEDGPTVSLFSNPADAAYRNVTRASFGQKITLAAPVAVVLDTAQFPDSL